MTRPLNRQQRRANQSEYIRTLEAENRRLVELVEAGQTGGGLIPVETGHNVIAQFERQGAFYKSALEFMAALKDLELIACRVDSAAVHCTLSALPNAVKGLDAQLSAAFTTLAGAAQTIDIPPNMLQAIMESTRARITAIQSVRRDNGVTLREVVKETSVMFASAAQQLEHRARQGQMTAPRTKRLIDYAQHWKYNDGRTWGDAAAALIADLRGRIDTLDELDQDILSDLEHRADPERAEYLRTMYHKKRERI